MRATALGLLLLATVLVAQDDPEPYGHSRHGAEFDEGPRQAAYLMPGMGDQVRFPVGGLTAEAQRFFDQGVTQLHGFWYYEAERSFRQVVKLQPGCAMAYWGLTMANIEHHKRATGFIANAVECAVTVPKNEQLWIDAWAAYYGIDDKSREELQSGDKDRLDKAKQALEAARVTFEAAKDRARQQEQRDRKLLKALGTIVYEYPDDIEAKAFLAIQNWHAYAWGGGIPIVSHTAIDALLDQVFRKAPRHPAHHYRIHLWDREDARRSLLSAAVIGSTAPGIAHEWHMAGHIYAKLDRHAEAAWQQEASGRADHAHMQRDRVMPFEIHNYGHNQEWLCRSLSLVGRAEEALALAKNMAELPRHPTKNQPDKGGDIAAYARRRLVSICEEHELWQQAVELNHDGFLDAGGEVTADAARLRLLGRALFRLGRIDEAERIVAEAGALLVRARRERAEGIDKAETKAFEAGQERKQTDEAMAEAQREGSSPVRSVLQLQRELEAERKLAAGDAVAALAIFEQVTGLPNTLLADAHVAAGEASKAVEILSKEVKARPGRLPTLRRLVAAHRAADQADAAELIAELERQIAAIPTDLAGFGDDFGQRPPLDSLGPFRWCPMPAPALELSVAGGGDFRLAGGGPTLVVFYLGFGCLHCVEQLQAIAPMAAEFQAAGIRVVAVGTDTAAKAQASLSALAAKDRLPFPLLADPKLEAFKAWRCYDDFEAMPLHGCFLVDGDGRVRWQDISYEPFTAVQWLLGECRRLLALPAAAGSK